MNIVRELRKRAGMQQKELASILNVSVATISDWETQKKNPSGDRLKKLAEVFDVDALVILGAMSPPPEGEDDTWALRERYRRDPDMRILFDAAAKATPAQLRAAAAVIKALEGGETT